MKARFLGGLLCAGLSVSMISAQELIPSVAAGSKAVLFTFNGLSNLGAGAYNGGIGAKYFLSNPMAIRAALQFATVHAGVPAASDSGTDGSVSVTQLGISGGVEYHLSMNRLSPFVGAILGFSTASTKSVSSTNSPKDTVITIKNNENGEMKYPAGTGINLNAIGGAEFFITKELSLSAEYQFGYNLVMRPDQKITKVTGTHTEIDTKKLGSLWTLGISNGGSLTLAVYF